MLVVDVLVVVFVVVFVVAQLACVAVGQEDENNRRRTVLWNSVWMSNVLCGRDAHRMDLGK